jgi:signal transduction histidine kinase
VATAFIPVLDRDGDGAVVAAAAGDGASRLEGRRVEGGAGVCGRIALGGEAGLFSVDTQIADPLFPDGAPAEIVFAPIAYRQRVLGGVCAVPAGEVGAALVECVRLLARFLSGGLQGARHFDRLRLARDHHQRLLAVLPDPLWLVGSGGRVEECNTPARDLLQHEGVGESVATLFDGEVGEQIAAAVVDAGTGERHDLRLGLGASAVPCLVSVLPFAGTASESGALVVARDISEWIASEREREQMRAATEESARLASVGELATGMAHEINNPLMGIINYADLAREELSDDSPVAEWMGVIIEEGERIAALLRHLRSLGRRDPQPPAATGLSSAVESACALVRHSLGREQIDLVVDISEGLPPVRAVSHQLQQVLVALFSNARWAVAEARRRGTEGRGWIRLTAREVATEGGGEVRVEVEDSGVGIAEEDLVRVFDPFFTRRSGRSGLGLGLTQARRDVGAWRGRIYAEQGEEGGARICLLIPRWEEER